MPRENLKWLGIILLVVCGVLLFVAYERYQDNASKVNAMNQMLGNSPLGDMRQGPGARMKPATPTATKYALLFAAVSGIAGAVCLIKSAAAPPPRPPASSPPGSPPETPEAGV
jgi:hypothetical protein